MSLDDSFSNCHAQTRSLGLRCKKGIEDALTLLGVQAWAVVADADAQGRLAVHVDLRAADLNVDRVTLDCPLNLLIERGTVRFGNETLHVVLAQHLARFEARQFFTKRAEIRDRVIGTENDDHARGSLDERAESDLAAFLVPRQPLSLGHADQAGTQRLGVDRLEDIVRRSLPQRLDRALQVRMAGHDQHRRLGRLRT